MMTVALWLAGSGSYPLAAQDTKPPVRRLGLLPAEQAWLVTLPASPAAGGAMDAERVYIPLGPRPVETVPQPGTEQVVALDRETGEQQWARDVPSAWAPLVAGGTLFVAAADGVHALDAETGAPRWHAPLAGDLLASPVLAPDLVLVLTASDGLTALRAADGTTAWQTPLEASMGPAFLLVDDDAVYVSLTGARVVRASLRDGRRVWERTLSGALGPPAIARDRLLVGSTDNHLYALDPDDGSFEWRYPAGADVVGAGAAGDDIFFVAFDNLLRALNRGNGNQQWKSLLQTRASGPPRVFDGVVLVSGLSPALAAFAADTGEPLGVYAAPSDLVAPALVDPALQPFRVAIVAIAGDGRVAGLRPSQMMFREPAPVPLTVLPGRTLDPEAGTPAPRTLEDGEPGGPAFTTPPPPR